MMFCSTVAKEPGQAGFTLVEMLVSITILAIGILALGQVFAVSNQNASFGRTETLAVSLAREIQEGQEPATLQIRVHGHTLPPALQDTSVLNQKNVVIR